MRRSWGGSSRESRWRCVRRSAADRARTLDRHSPATGAAGSDLQDAVAHGASIPGLPRVRHGGPREADERTGPSRPCRDRNRPWDPPPGPPRARSSRAARGAPRGRPFVAVAPGRSECDLIQLRPERGVQAVTAAAAQREVGRMRQMRRSSATVAAWVAAWSETQARRSWTAPGRRAAARRARSGALAGEEVGRR